MKAYLKSDGGFVIGKHHISRNTPVGLLYSSDDSQVKIAPVDGSTYFYYNGPVNALTDEAGTAYADRAAFETATKDFFFKLAGGVTSDGFLYLPNSATGLRVRIGQRAGWYWAVDQELTETGFTGDEGVDWENIAGNEIPA